MKLPQSTTKQISRVAARLLRGERLDHRTIDKHCGSYRVASPISQLRRKYEWDIRTEQVLRTTRDPVKRHAHYTIYWLDESVMQFFGQEGQNYANEVLKWEDRKKEERELAATKTHSDEDSDDDR